MDAPTPLRWSECTLPVCPARASPSGRGPVLMCPRISRTVIVVAAGLLSSASSAVAQGHAVPAPTFVQPGAAPTFVSADCGTHGAVSAVPTERPGFAARVWNAVTIGEGCRNPVGCGNFASERTFLFGSCRQFFNAGYKCSVFGAGLLGHCPCEYGSYLNR